MLRLIFVLLFWAELIVAVFGATKFSLSVIPSNQPIYLGQKVILTCQLKGFETPISYAVLFKHDEFGISERCQTYYPSKYQLDCHPNDARHATTYKLYIKSVSWTDRGDWFCVYAANLTKQRLLVYAPAELKTMRVAGVDSPSILQPNPNTIRTSPKDDLVVARPSVSQARVSSSADSRTVTSVKQAPLSQHIGLGTRTNPYDLRPGFGLQLTCETTCGYPDANITWFLLNNTSSKPARTTVGPNQVRSDICNRSQSTTAMSMTTSTLKVDCLRSNLVGLNEVQCAVSGKQYKDHVPTRYVYVLCPDWYELSKLRQSNLSEQRGERPLQLMQGEVVGIAVGAAIALILLFIFCIVVRKSRKESPLNPTIGHFLGHRV